VTGLVVFDTYTHWSIFGQIVILTLVQIGGLGFMSVGVFFAVFLRRRIGLRERGLLQESMNALQIGGIVRLVKKIMKGTLLFEGIGGVILSLRFIPEMGVARGIYNGFFHSISAFCNSGIDLMGKYEPYSSLTRFFDDPVVNLVIAVNLVVGSLGFIVWDDISNNKLRFKKYMLHTKLVIVTTMVLWAGGAVLFAVFENRNLLADMDVRQKFIACMFSSVSSRTAGFNSLDLASMTESSKLFAMILMFIGGSPGSTAGGVKTTTVVVILIYIWSNLRNNQSCEVFGRRIGDDVIKKASLVFGINLFITVVAAIALCSLQSFDAMDAVFEVVAAESTAGMTMGITKDLLTVPRLLIILLMYSGRVGSMSFALSFMERKKVLPVQAPLGKVTVG